jgi:hypothetical protein
LTIDQEPPEEQEDALSESTIVIAGSGDVDADRSGRSMPRMPSIKVELDVQPRRQATTIPLDAVQLALDGFAKKPARRPSRSHREPSPATLLYGPDLRNAVRKRVALVNGARCSLHGAPSHIQSEHWCTPQKLLKLPFLLKHCNGSRSAQVQNRLDLKELQELDAFAHTIASLETLLLFHGVALRPPDNRIKLLKGQVVCLFRFVFQNRPFSSQARHVQQEWPSAELVKEHPEALRF